MKKQWQFFWHVFVWVCLISFFFFIGKTNSRLSIEALLVLFVLFGMVNISLFYINYLLLIPKLLDRKRYGTYILIALGVILAYGFFKYGLALVYKEYALVKQKGQMIGFTSYYLSAFFTSLIFVFLSIVLKFSTDWFLNERIQRDLENQRLTAELSFLKSQVNPHFLFNSLNSIYSLAYQRSETTPEAILKLSEIMRYMLYESNDNKVDLEKEIHYLQNYIDLQKIRFGYKAFVEFEVKGDVTTQRIAPLLLISFIENAFKHGVANDPETPIRMNLMVDNGTLDFHIENKKHNNNRDASGGIGLSNVKRRLNLLYPKKYALDIDDTETFYVCNLKLVL
ncbi:sensor histidine kinase [Mucilaginibacter roseus]|uniref:Sensor histidine kinase n=1 Tax=Mucilaginibacter roseus TaxID=1528868 RepID=A0ABS8U4D6_9SPHI|nr:sensor histidine kinase [Mucilaginibacter roseus]MCD8740702.1 sensor histidine kinase [Mucilaginibacter roseus]